MGQDWNTGDEADLRSHAGIYLQERIKLSVDNTCGYGLLDL